jgi:cell division septal protein FtsQ
MAATRTKQKTPIAAEAEAPSPPPEEVEAPEVLDAPDAADAEAPADEPDPVEPEEPPRRRRTSKSRSGDGRAMPRKRRSLRQTFDPRQLKLPFGGSEMIRGRTAKVGGGIMLFVLLIVGLYVAYYLFSNSRFFALSGVDVEGNKLLSDVEVETMVRAKVPKGVLNADLMKIRDELQLFPLIRQATVVRLLPDRLRVVIAERAPIAVARLADGNTACIDEEGALFGTLAAWRGQDKPLIRGVAETGERKTEINRGLVNTYKRLLEELDQNDPPLSSRIDEVTFDPDQGVRVALANSPIVVLLGRNDFRARLNIALDVIEAVRAGDADRLTLMRIGDAERLLDPERKDLLRYLNVTDPTRIVVGLDE